LRLLLDAHVLLWWLSSSPRLPKAARTAIEDCEVAYVSAATVWEVAIKVAARKLEFRGDMEEQLALNNFHPLPITVIHALLAAKLPRHHADPFDRMLVAQASFESLTLVTADPQLAVYGVPILRA
jgi:PIN domain nuclease of toxin-antitoxin system